MMNSGAVRTVLLSEELDLYRVTIKCGACGFEEQHTVKGKDMQAFEQGLVGKACGGCQAPSYTILTRRT